ncbi:kinetochore-associated protein NSL1 homolog [Anneissia japonica]|uniref:kinetochore-associated protein NSL1 homolog n=1 Tax=Anneissia japonica TaxID=1529436 RepID=UPI0014257114|nr:kinetochore-associated protein NSL1 homolog [Anneissia japonica]
MDDVKPSQILCHNKRSVKHAICAVCSAVSKAIADSSQLNDDQKERLTKRFIEMYETTQHENILIDGQTWSNVGEETPDKAQEYDPIDVKRRREVEELAITLDAQIVTTTSKRKNFPKAVSQQVARKLMSEHAALEEYHPTPEANVDEEIKFSLSQASDSIVNAKLKESAEGILSCVKTIPSLEEKCERVNLALNSYYKVQESKTSQVIDKPSRGESVMASSMRELTSRITTETPSPIKRKSNVTDETYVKRLKNHPISYNLRRTSFPNKKYVN